MPKIHYICNAVILDCNSIFNQNNQIMRKKFATQIAAIALATAIAIPSCTKEEYNLNNIGHEIMFETSIAAPILKERTVTLTDFFDMEGLTGKLAIDDDDDVKKVKEILGANTNCLEHTPDGKYYLNLKKMNGLDLEKLANIGVTVEDDLLPTSSDFIEIDDLDKTFGEGNVINEIDEFKITMDIANNTDFQITLGIAFAFDVPDFFGQGETIHAPIPDTEATADAADAAPNNTHMIVIPPKSAKKEYSLSFKKIAKTIRDFHSTGLIITYGLGKGENGTFRISATDNLSMNLKAFIKATIDLSNID